MHAFTVYIWNREVIKATDNAVVVIIIIIFIMKCVYNKGAQKNTWT
jgi:hypothetical protein